MTLFIRLVSPSGETLREQTITEFPARIGCDPDVEISLADAFATIAAVHAVLDRTPDGIGITSRSQEHDTLLNGLPLFKPTQLRQGDRVGLGATGPVMLIVAVEDAPHSGLVQTVAGRPSEIAAVRRTVAAITAIKVGDGGVVGRDPTADFQLPHPLVSRYHAALGRRDGQVVLSDLGSANGTYLNGVRLSESAVLGPGDSIDVGPYSLVFDGESLIGASRSNNVELVARDVTRTVRDRATGKPLTLLNAVSIVVRPREFVCLLGPSGSGKSTLLTILSGRSEPNAGAVLVNGQNLHGHFDALKRDIAVVPQREVLHESLAVGMALQYTAELRLPPDTGRVELFQTVHEMLGVVGLARRRATLIRHLSGGQVKRASLANELICKPTLLFLDEVTSGLDEQTDRDMMELFRQVADDGKTVVCITHNLANVEATCHLVALLTEGGRLAFFGPPEAAKDYFKVARLGEVYRKLSTRPAEEWEAEFRLSPFYAEYLESRLPAETVVAPARTPGSTKSERGRTNPIRQLKVLTRRYISVWRGDVVALFALLGQSLLVALLLGVVFGNLPGIENPAERTVRTSNLLFLLNVSCFWLGCNNAAKELVRERAIFRRERDINLRADSYYASKFVVLLCIGILQVTLLFGIVYPWAGQEGSLLIQWLILVSLIAAGTALGLLISACSPTEEVASALVPLAVIPQIILAGVIAPLSGLGKLLGYGLITCFWGRRALEASLPDESLVWLGREELPIGPQIGVILVHMAAFIAATIVILWYQARLPRLMARFGR